MKLISNIFENEPRGWGLRGDPNMWKELANSFVGLKMNLSQKEFEEELENRFNEIIERTGEKRGKESVWFEDFPQHGMSGGSISLKWWRVVGLPLIKNRYEEINKNKL